MSSVNDFVTGVCAIVYLEDFTSRRECLLAANRFVLPPSYIYEVEEGFRFEWSLKHGEVHDDTLAHLKHVLNAREIFFFHAAKRISSHPEWVYTIHDMFAAATLDNETAEKIVDPDLLWNHAYKTKHERYIGIYLELKRRGMSTEAVEIMWDAQPIGDRRTHLGELAPFLEAVLHATATAMQKADAVSVSTLLGDRRITDLPFSPRLEGHMLWFFFQDAYDWWGKGTDKKKMWQLLSKVRFFQGQGVGRNVMRTYLPQINLFEAAEDGLNVPAVLCSGIRTHEAPKEKVDGVAQGG